MTERQLTVVGVGSLERLTSCQMEAGSAKAFINSEACAGYPTVHVAKSASRRDLSGRSRTRRCFVFFLLSVSRSRSPPCIFYLPYFPSFFLILGSFFLQYRLIWIFLNNKKHDFFFYIFICYHISSLIIIYVIYPSVPFKCENIYSIHNYWTRPLCAFTYGRKFPVIDAGGGGLLQQPGSVGDRPYHSEGRHHYPSGDFQIS